MTTFKPGDRVFSIFSGVVTLSDSYDACYPISDGKHALLRTGFLGPDDAAPSLYTLEDARRMGFPVPSEPVVYETEVLPCGDGSVAGRIYNSRHELRELIGKRVRVTVEAIEGESE